MLELMVSIQTLSDHFDILSDPKTLGQTFRGALTKQMFTSRVQRVMLVLYVILTNSCRDESDATLCYACLL